MEGITWHFIFLVIVVIASVCYAIYYDKESNTKKVGEAANAILVMILSSLWIPLWLFIQWFIGLIITQIPIDESIKIFFTIFRWIFAIVTLIFVLIEVIKNIVLAYITAIKKIKE